jgi:hypothetical protein
LIFSPGEGVSNTVIAPKETAVRLHFGMSGSLAVSGAGKPPPTGRSNQEVRLSLRFVQQGQQQSG